MFAATQSYTRVPGARLYCHDLMQSNSIFVCCLSHWRGPDLDCRLLHVEQSSLLTAMVQPSQAVDASSVAIITFYSHFHLFTGIITPRPVYNYIWIHYRISLASAFSWHY